MFTEARIKITLWYLVIIMVIITLFSLAIFQVLAREVHRFAFLQQQQLQLREQNPNVSLLPGRPLRVIVRDLNNNLEDDLLSRIKVLLILVNSLILVISGILSFILAGKTLEPIEEMIENQKRFVSDASHELKTPLTAVRTSIEVALRDKNLQLAEAKEVLESSLEELQVLQSMAQSLLHLSHTATENYAQLQALSLEKVVATAVKKMSPLARKKKIELQVSLGEKLPLMVPGIELEIREAVVILLDNAIKFSPANTQVGISLSSKRKRAYIQVSDQGPGIAPEHSKYIFDRFYRVDSSRCKDAEGGYGLGLAIAQRIITNHQGSLSVQSELGHGTTFTIVLPI